MVQRMGEHRKAFAHDSVVQVAERLLKETDGTTSEHGYMAQWHLAQAHDALGDPVTATAFAQQAFETARAMGDRELQLKSLNQLSHLATVQSRYTDAYRYRRDHFALAMQHGDSAMLVASLNNMGNMFSHRLMTDSAEWAFRLGLAHVPGKGCFEEIIILSNLGGLLSEQGRHDEAIPLLERSVQRVDSSDHRSMARALNNLGFGLMEAGRHGDAIQVIDRSELHNQLSDRMLDLSIDNLDLRARSLSAQGRHAEAYATMRELKRAQDSLFASTLDERLLEQEKRFETQLKEEEIQRLDAVTSEQAAQIKARNLMLYGSLVLVLLAIAALLLIWRNFRQKRHHAEVLEGLNAELKDQKQKIEEINGLLRMKVLRTQMNPHFIYNCLNAIGNLVRKGDAVAASAYLDGFARLLRMVLDHSVKDRVPISQELDFLRQYLKLEALRFPDGLHYTVDADPGLIEDDVHVPALLVQPFVENAIWHGLAGKEGEKRLSVSFAEVDGVVRCNVEDNGVGRKAAPKRAHSDGSPSMGLQLTNERLQLLAFKLAGSGRIQFEDLHQADGTAAGTRVEVVLDGGT